MDTGTFIEKENIGIGADVLLVLVCVYVGTGWVISLLHMTLG